MIERDGGAELWRREKNGVRLVVVRNPQHVTRSTAQRTIYGGEIFMGDFAVDAEQMTSEEIVQLATRTVLIDPTPA